MTLFEILYYIGYSIKKHYVLKNQKKLPCRVLSIGNITVGGTGKTPATIEIAREAKRRGFKPAVLTRGYKGKKQGPCFISIGGEPLLNEKEAGDEPILLAKRLRGIPLVKGEDRYEAGIFALNSLPAPIHPDIFILDDGFQHWNLFRDSDILLIDSSNPFGNRRLLPSGPLREPLKALNRGDLIVITKMGDIGDDTGVNSLVKEIKKYNKRAPIFLASHSPVTFIKSNGESLPLEWFKGKRFFGFSGIGNPESFTRTLLSVGINVKGLKQYRDHYRYSAKDIERIIEESNKVNADWIVTTEKDIMRLTGFDLPENLVFLRIEFHVNDKFFEQIFNF